MEMLGLLRLRLRELCFIDSSCLPCKCELTPQLDAWAMGGRLVLWFR